LAALHDLVLELQNYYAIEIKWPDDPEWLKKNKIDESLFDASFAFARQNHERALNQMMVEIRSMGIANSAERQAAAGRIYAQLQPKYKTSVCQCLAMKIRMNLAYLMENYEEAAEIAEAYIPLLIEMKDEFSSSMIARELQFVSVLNTLLNNRNAAIRYVMKISELKPNCRLDENFIPRYRMIAYATIAVCFSELKLAKMAQSEIIKIETEMSLGSFCRNYHNIGAVFFMNEDFQNAARCFHKVRNVAKKGMQFLQWEPSLYLAISHFELGDIDLADSMLESVKNATEGLELAYPKRCLAIVGKYIKMGRSHSFLNHELMKELEAIEMLMTNDEERRSSNLFAASIWIKSILQARSQTDILRDGITHDLMKLRVATFN
jgi:tetratricopeptide (TPR) repeat protein